METFVEKCVFPAVDYETACLQKQVEPPLEGSAEAMERLERRGGRTTDLAGLMSASDIVISTTGVPGLISPP